MMTKLKFLWVLLALLVGNVNEAWADALSFNFSAYLSATSGSPTITTSFTGDNTISSDVNLYFTYYSTEGNSGSIPSGISINVDDNTYYYAKMNGNDNFFEVSGYTFKAGDVVTLYLYTNSSTVGYKVGKTAQSEVTAANQSKGTIVTLAHTLTTAEIEGNGYLRIYRNSSNTYFAGLTVTGSRTITNYTTAQSYPHKWDFTDNDLWTTSITQMTTGGDGQWRQVISNGSVTEYRPNAEKSSWGYNVELIKGLTFSTVNKFKPCLDHANKQLYLSNGTTITIPGLTANQRIEVTGTYTIGTVLNTTYDDGIYTVTTAGDIYLPLTADSWIKSIEVMAPDDGSVEYPYAWDLTSWTTDLTTNTNYWSANNVHAYKHAHTFIDNGGANYLTTDGTTFIKEIKGLKFLPGMKDNNYQTDRIKIDTENGYMIFGAGCSVVIPSTTAGQIIYIDGYISGNAWGGVTVTGATLISGNWDVTDTKSDKFYVSTGGDVTITMASNDMYLYRLAVNNAITVTSTSPSNGDNGVAITKKPTLTTNYTITSIDLTVTDAGSNTVAGTTAISNNKTTFTPSANLSSWTTYTMSVLAGGIVQKIEKSPFRESNFSTNVTAFNASFTTTGLGFDSSIPADGSEIAGNMSLSSNKIVVQYKSNISLVDGANYTDITISDGTTTYAFNASGNTISDKQAQLDCPITLESGNSYTITIPAGTFKDGNGMTNAENTFSFRVDATPPGIVMVIPATMTDVSIATRIVVSSDDNTNKELDLTTAFTATLSASGQSDVTLTAVATGTHKGWAFKPSTALQTNTTYTLTIPANSMVTKNGTRIASDKTFTFTTVSSTSGTAPELLKTNGNSSPYENEVISDFKDGIVSLKFDQTITLMDGAVIEVVPIGGSEYNSKGEYYTGIGTGYNNEISVSGSQLSFKFSNNDMHYDLYYRVLLPANTLTGTGGVPNNADEYIFKVGPASGYTGSYNFQNKEGYPYTWDFTTISSSSSTITANGAKWKKATDSQTSTEYYYRNTMSDCYCKELNGNNTSNDVLNDFRGLRFGTKRANYSSNSSNGGPIRIFEPSTDGSGNMRIHGNTHYMTIPNVPASADDANGDHYIYIRASVSNGNAVLALNAPSSVAEWVGTVPQAGQGVQVYKVRVKTAGDIPFVCSDVNIYQIAVSTYNKTLTSGGEGYATDAHDYHTTEISDKGVDYAMTATLDGKTVTPYYVTNVASGGDDKTPGTVTLTQVSGGVTPGQGTVLIGTAGETFPVFVKAYSKQNSESSSNKLTGVVDANTVDLGQTTTEGESTQYNYVLNNQYIRVLDDGSEPVIGSGTGIGFYLIHKAITIPMQAHSAYLSIDSRLNQGGNLSGVSTAREVYFFKFEDENGNELTSISPIEADGIKDSYTNGNGLYYDLRGQRHVYPTKPGLYIHNGKKIYLK